MVRAGHSDELAVRNGRSPSYPRELYAWYVVAVLMFAYIVSYVDRSILTLLVEPIKRDIGVSDTQVSLLHGFAFAIFYTLMGFPIGRLADRRHRVGIIAIGVALWSIMTAACGIARTFAQLFLARVGVGFGEAALNPAAYSLIADYFRPSVISRATSTYVMGTYLGFGIAYIVGGAIVAAVADMPSVVLPVVGPVAAWQTVFFFVAAPGVLVMILLATIREPVRRDRLRNVPSEQNPGVTLAEFGRFLKLNSRTFTAHAAGFGCLGLLVNGMALWTPTFLARTYGWELSDAGIAYGLLLLVFGGSGVWLGGWMADRIDRSGRVGGPFVTASLCAVGVVAPAIAYPLMPTAQLSLIVMAPMILCSSAPWGVAVSALQQMAPNELRGQVGAFYLFTVNLIGIGLGPTLVALLTDYWFGDPAALRYSMVVVSGTAAIAAALSLRWGLPHFRDSLDRALAWQRQG